MTLEKQPSHHEPEEVLRMLFDVAVQSADPIAVIPRALPERPSGRVFVTGAGKASARMAEAVELAWGPCEGLVITRYGHERPTERIEIATAAHPIPDATGQAATKRILQTVSTYSEEDTVLVLMSGGGSSLLSMPAKPLSLTDKQTITHRLLASGAPIDQINLVRKHLSCVKGGRLAAAAYPANVICLAISDVPGDDPADIASGPTVGVKSAPDAALDILERWQVPIPQAVKSALTLANAPPAPDDPRLATTETHVIAAPRQSLVAAAEMGRKLGYDVEILGDNLEGEARILGADHAALSLARKKERKGAGTPLLLISGGECTVTRQGDGSGGPNAEYALSMAIALEGEPGIHVIACDTDGIDGYGEPAGAMVNSRTLLAARDVDMNAQTALLANDAHGFFGAVDGSVITGPTLTNVNDFRAILIQPEAQRYLEAQDV